MRNLKGNWFTDMIRDNFWMMVALIYSAPPPIVNTQMPDDLEYLFANEPTGNIDNTLHDELHYHLQDLSDNLSEWHDNCHDEVDNNFGYDSDLDLQF